MMLVLAGLGAAAAFAPAWDSFTLRTAAGQSQSLTAGNAFSNPGLVVAANLAVMIAFAAAVSAAALWRPVRHGAVLLAGALIPMAAQAISALLQAATPASPAQFGISNAQAAALRLTIDSGLTPAFWIYCAFGLVLLVSCVWMLCTPQQAAAPGLVPTAGLVPPAGDGLTAGPHESLSAGPRDADADDEDGGEGDRDGAHQAAPAQGLK